MLTEIYRVVDDNGETLTCDYQSGELCVRSPMLMSGYLGDEAATRGTIDEQGWLHTGDVGFMKMGKMYIIDRKKVNDSSHFKRSG